MITRLEDALLNEYQRLNERYLIDTYHSIDRFKDDERFNNFASTQEFKNQIVEVAKDAERIIINKYNDKSMNYGIHSKSTGIGFPIEWRLDKYNRVPENNMILVTLFPIKKYHTFNKDDKIMIVEDLLRMYYTQVSGKKIRRNQYSTCDVHNEYLEDKKNISNSTDFKIVFFEGKLYDTSIDEWIFVD